MATKKSNSIHRLIMKSDRSLFLSVPKSYHF